jgi:hypothetical protein
VNNSADIVIYEDLRQRIEDEIEKRVAEKLKQIKKSQEDELVKWQKENTETVYVESFIDMDIINLARLGRQAVLDSIENRMVTDLAKEIKSKCKIEYNKFYDPSMAKTHCIRMQLTICKI